MPKTCFATVGTTQFDALVSSLLSEEVLGLLAHQGYTRLLLQVGRGAEPRVPACAPLAIEWCAPSERTLRGPRPASLGPSPRAHANASPYLST